MIRRRQVLPDETGTVSQEALIQALIEAASWLDFAGGCLLVVTDREATGFPGEMVTRSASVEWRSSASANPASPAQFERPTNALAPEPVPEPEPPGARVPPEYLTPSDDNPDGFEFDKLEPEDVEPEHAR
jgi:hypothetical protein